MMKIIYPTDIDSVVPYYGDNRFFINVDGTPNRVEMSTSDSTNRGSIVHFVVNNVQLDQDGIADLMDSIADDVELLVDSYFENDNQFTDDDLKLIDERCCSLIPLCSFNQNLTRFLFHLLVFNKTRD